MYYKCHMQTVAASRMQWSVDLSPAKATAEAADKPINSPNVQPIYKHYIARNFSKNFLSSLLSPQLSIS